MKQYDVGSIPVCEQEQVIGIITDRDITLRSVASGKDMQQQVADIMTTQPIVGSPDMNVHEAAQLMSQQQIRRLPIVENSRLVGILALGDISTQPEFQNEAEHALKNISQSHGSRME